MKKVQLAFFALFLIIGTASLGAQPALERDPSLVMEIPSVITLSSSPAHLYVLSEEEGLAVFRTYGDSLQWLYTSPNMERRGNTITADIRFAYLFGKSNRLTILEPTSVMGVYSSTRLPTRPIDAERIGQRLFLALGDKGLGRISLSTPAAVDSTLHIVEGSILSGETIIDLETQNNRLFVLSVGGNLHTFRFRNDNLSLIKSTELSAQTESIFVINNSLLVTDEEGTIYEIAPSDKLLELGRIGEPVAKIEQWNDWLIIRGNSNRLWISYQKGSPQLWKKNKDGGNYFTVSEADLWLSEYNHISKIRATEQLPTARLNESQTYLNRSFSLAEIADQIIPHTKPLLFPLVINGQSNLQDVQFSYRSTDIEHAEIRGQSFYWRPGYNDIGIHHLKIIAVNSSGEMDSASFTIDVRSFNAPPRFAPIRPISIPVGEKFTLPIKATDPDGMNPNLIRFLGVNLPYGASIDQQTGTFTWTPTMRHMGENDFRVIATDQYGAAASVDVTINVIENLRRDN